MKFLIIGKQKDSARTLPPALARQLTEESVAAANQQKKEGLILEIYWIPGAYSTVTLGECKSAEEMVKIFSDQSIAAYYDYEIHPLADFNESMNILIERLKRSEKMMQVPSM
jgi:muconolactone delta-isomerase